jgi:hypothetical protein
MEKVKKTITAQPTPLLLLSSFDRIYYCVFSFVMKTPQRDMPHVASSMIMALIMIMHTVLLLAFIKSKAGIQMALVNVKIIIVLIVVLSCFLTGYYYYSKKNGDRIVKHYKEKMDARVSAIIGFIVFIESAFLPVIIGIIYRLTR